MYHVWERGTVPNEHICKVIIRNMEYVGVMGLNTVVRSKLPIYRTDLDYANMIVPGRNVQIISDTDRIVQASPFTPD